MARKVFISFLGKSNYSPCVYVRDDYKSQPIRFIQEATVEYINSKTQWTKDDVAYFLLTEDAEKANWVDNGQVDRKTNLPIAQEGLNKRINSLGYPFKINAISNLPIGNNEKEIWEIFEKLFAVIKDEDELYFDLTHGFRYLPMLVLVCGNYSKFLRKVSVKSITYGNFEFPDTEKPIVDLLPLSQLQDWTYAAGQYLDSGNVEKLVELSDKELKPLLKEAKGLNADATNLKQFIKYLKIVVEERQTCRGISIVRSDSFRRLKHYSDNLQTSIIEPLNPIIDKIKQSFADFDVNENVANGFAAANWCINNGLHQQAATILYENIVTVICKQHSLNWQIEKDRSVVTIAFKVAIDDSLKDEKNWNLGLKKDASEGEKQSKLAKIKEVLKDEMILSLKESFNTINTLRNDVNHCGMRNNPISPENLKNRIKQCLSDVEKICCPVACDSPINAAKILINLSNHPSANWSEAQITAAKQFGAIVDLPFPVVDPAGAEEDIAALADEYAQKVRELANGKNTTVHLMGEMTLTFALVERIQAEGIDCVASTTQRIVTEIVPNHKEVIFQFVRFRRYN